MTHLRRVSSNENVEKRLHFNADSSTLEFLMRTALAMNPLTIYHAVSIWFNRVQKMHQGEPDFELNISVDDVSTLIQHVMRPTAHQNSRVWEKCQEKPDLLRESQWDKHLRRNRPCSWRFGESRRSAESTHVQETQKEAGQWRHQMKTPLLALRGSK